MHGAPACSPAFPAVRENTVLREYTAGLVDLMHRISGSAFELHLSTNDHPVKSYNGAAHSFDVEHVH